MVRTEFDRFTNDRKTKTKESDIQKVSNLGVTYPGLVDGKVPVSQLPADYLAKPGVYNGAGVLVPAKAFWQFTSDFVLRTDLPEGDRMEISLASSGNPPKGHDPSLMTGAGVRSHWKCLSSEMGTTTLTDAYGHHSGTAAASLVARGVPFYTEDGRVLIWQQVDLEETSPLDSQDLRDLVLDDFWWMGWVVCATGSRNDVWQYSGGSPDTEVNNALAIVSIDGSELESIWEYGSGSNTGGTPGPISYGLRHIYMAWERDAPTSGQTTLHAAIDGIFLPSISGITSPTGGTNGEGSFPAAAGTGMAWCDAVIGSGAFPTEAQVQAQVARRWGVY